MDESVTVLIEGEDRASEKLAEAAANVERTAGRIKTVTSKTKISTEFIGSFASALGGSEIASFASQFGGLNEKVSQFTDLVKGGGVGSVALKAGLAGVVGYASFEFGKTIGNAVFETEKWNTLLDQSKTRLAELGEKSLELANDRFSKDFAEIKLIEDPEQQRAEMEKLYTQAGNNAKTYGERLASVQKQMQELAGSGGVGSALNAVGDLKNMNFAGAYSNAADALGGGKLEELKAMEAELKKQIESANASIQSISTFRGRESEDAAIAKAKEEQQKLNDLVAATAKAEETTVQKLRDQLVLEQAIGKEKFAVQAAQMVSDESKRVEVAALLEQQDALAQMRNAEKQAEQEQMAALKAKEDQLNKINSLRDNELQKLKEMEIRQTKGDAAADSFVLQNQGLSKTDADFIANEKARLSADPKKEKIQGNGPGLQAIQSRFLRAAPGGGDPAAVTAENSKRMVDHLNKLVKIQEAAGNMENVDRLKGEIAKRELIA